MCLLRPARTRHRHRRERPGLVITIQCPTLLPGAPDRARGACFTPIQRHGPRSDRAGMPDISLQRTTKRAACALAAVLTAIGMIAAAGCGSGAPTAGPGGVEKPDLTIGVVPAVSNAGAYIADQRGYFTAEGLHVKLVPITSSADVLAFLLDGKVDVLAGNYVSEIQAEASNPAVIQLRILAEGALTAPHSRAIMIPAGSPIRDLAQLRGKTVAVNALNNAASMLVDSALAANGIPPAAVHLVAIGFPAEAAALNAHPLPGAA